MEAVLRPGATRGKSEKVRARAESLRKTFALLVTGISPGKLHTIEPRMFGKLDIDPAYQRGRTHEIRDIVRVLQSGGMVPDPVTLCRRPWSGDDTRLWIVDGHQRVCAFQQLGLPFQAMIHESDSLDAEKNLFQALNTKRGISANIIVKSWTGESSDLIVAASKNSAHPLYQRVNLQQGTRGNLIAASSLVRGLCTVIGAKPQGPITKALGRIDFELATKSKERRAFAEHFLRLVGMIWPSGSVHVQVMTNLGRVAHEHWTEGGLALPSTRAIERLRKINWPAEVPHLTTKFDPIIINILKKAWK